MHTLYIQITFVYNKKIYSPNHYAYIQYELYPSIIQIYKLEL